MALRPRRLAACCAVLAMCAFTAVAWPARAATTVDITVLDQGHEYFPNSKTVHPGDSVRWTVKGVQAHSVTADSGAFDSGPIAPHQSYVVKFTDVGTYSYHCSLPNHGGAATILVVADEAAPPTTVAIAPPAGGPVGQRPRPSTATTTAGSTTAGTAVSSPAADSSGATTEPTYAVDLRTRFSPYRFTPPTLATRRATGLPGPIRFVLEVAAILALAGLGWELLRGRIAVPAFPAPSLAVGRRPWRSAGLGVDVPDWDERDLS